MSKFKDYLLSRYPSLSVAAKALNIPYPTLYRNIQHPTFGWKYITAIVEKVMTERDDAIEKLRYTQDEYARLARAYNTLIDQLNESKDERIWKLLHYL